MVGTMLEVGAERRTLAAFSSCSRAPLASGGETAPAHGLYLVSVTY